MEIIREKFNWRYDIDKMDKLTRIDDVVLHHAAGDNYTVQEIHEMHLRKGWAGIGYHFYIRKDGKIYQGRPINIMGAQCKGHNSHSIGVCCEGNFEHEHMPIVQRKSLKKLLKELGITKIYGHKEWKATACPGKYFPLQEMKNLMTSKYSSETLQLQKDLNKLYNLGLATDGLYGDKTTEAVVYFQKDRKIKIDGIYGPQSKAEIKKALKEIERPALLIKNLQKLLNEHGFDCGKVDGIYGPKTYGALENMVNRLGGHNG